MLCLEVSIFSNFVPECLGILGLHIMISLFTPPHGKYQIQSNGYHCIIIVIETNIKNTTNRRLRFISTEIAHLKV